MPERHERLRAEPITQISCTVSQVSCWGISSAGFGSGADAPVGGNRKLVAGHDEARKTTKDGC
eukprot:765521-Hanusia_phi.AAC.12